MSVTLIYPLDENQLKWHRRFLALAKHVSEWSKDTTKVGVVITDPETHQVISIGYNGFPRGVRDNQERYDNRDEKLKYVVHGEVNAILNAYRSVRGCDIYIYPTMMVPDICPDCAKVVVQAGIKRAFFYKPEKPLSDRWQELSKFSQTILSEGGVIWQEIPE